MTRDLRWNDGFDRTYGGAGHAKWTDLTSVCLDPGPWNPGTVTIDGSTRCRCKNDSVRHTAHHADKARKRKSMLGSILSWLDYYGSHVRILAKWLALELLRDPKTRCSMFRRLRMAQMGLLETLVLPSALSSIRRHRQPGNAFPPLLIRGFRPHTVYRRLLYFM